MKQVLKCNTPDCSSTSTIQAEQPIADYVEDLQFSGFKDGSIASTGAVEYGMGNKKWFYPIKAEAINYPGTKSTCQSSMSNIALAFDEIPKLFGDAQEGKAAIKLTFNDYVRIEKVKLHTAAHLDGGNYYPYGYRNNPNYFSNKQWPSNDNVTYPYGKNHSLNGRYSFGFGFYYKSRRYRCNTT